MMRILTPLILVFAVSCGPGPVGSGGETPETPEVWENVKPTVYVASPGELAVGQSMTVLGQDFLEPSEGQQLLIVRGSYFDDQGAQHAVDLQVTPRHVNKTKLTWKMWPNIVFHPTGDRLGYFLGEVRVINVGKDGSQKTSDPYSVRIDVAPSLIARIVRPSTGSCQAVVDGTLEKVGMAFTVEAIGLRAGSVDAPLSFHWHFLAKHWKLSFGYNTTNPDANFEKETDSYSLQDTVTSGNVSVVTDGGDKFFLLKAGSDLLGDSSLKELRTQELKGEGDTMEASVNVSAVDASGKMANLAIPVEVSRSAILHYAGQSKVVERMPAVMVSECIPGGNIGRNVTYREDKSETRSRSVAFNYNANAALTLGLPSNPFALGANLSAGFGVDVNGSVSTTETQALDISSQILPGIYATFYRQTSKVERLGQLVGRNRCGQSIDLGEVKLTDWIFTPDLAQGACTPPTNLPPAGKVY